MHLADYWKKQGKIIRCQLCQRQCRISEGAFGFCGVRKNEAGKLYSIVYARPVAINVDPIEKKPFYNFNPGAKLLSFGTPGCNLRCKYCCNYSISQARLDEMHVPEIRPEEIVRMAKESKCQGIAYTYTEPTIFFEYARDTAKLAKKAGLFNVFVTNGYIMDKPLKDISPCLDAVVINFKGFNKKFYKEFTTAELEKIKKGALNYKKYTKAHIEISTLVVPGVDDSLKEFKQFVHWIKKNFGKSTPLHLIRFFPSYKMMDMPQTPVETMNKMLAIAKKEGLEYVYPGNVPDHELNNTTCPNCGEILIRRDGMQTIGYYVTKDKRCPKCKRKVNVYGSYWP